MLPDLPGGEDNAMKLRALRLLLAASLLPLGCDGGSGPSVGAPSAEKSVGDGSATAGGKTAKISAGLKKKKEKQVVGPAGTE
jgi:hypothetical protein